MLARYNNFKPFRLDLLDTLVNTIKKHKKRLMFKGLWIFAETIFSMYANIEVLNDYIAHRFISLFMPYGWYQLFAA